MRPHLNLVIPVGQIGEIASAGGIKLSTSVIHAQTVEGLLATNAWRAQAPLLPPPPRQRGYDTPRLID
jgi:hypothetical protein